MTKKEKKDLIDLIKEEMVTTNETLECLTHNKALWTAVRIVDQSPVAKEPIPSPGDNQSLEEGITIDSEEELLMLIIGAYQGHSWEGERAESSLKRIYEYALKRSEQLKNPIPPKSGELKSTLPNKIEESGLKEVEEKTRRDIAKIMEDNIDFHPQVNGFAVHGAIDKIIQYFKKP